MVRDRAAGQRGRNHAGRPAAGAGPRQEPTADTRTLSVLRAWLGENGNWDATAKALGLHRNSVRRQINALAELLDLDLNQAQVRAELWIALQYVDGLPGASRHA